MGAVVVKHIQRLARAVRLPNFSRKGRLPDENDRRAIRSLLDQIGDDEHGASLRVKWPRPERRHAQTRAQHSTRQDLSFPLQAEGPIPSDRLSDGIHREPRVRLAKDDVGIVRRHHRAVGSDQRNLHPGRHADDETDLIDVGHQRRIDGQDDVCRCPDAIATRDGAVLEQTEHIQIRVEQSLGVGCRNDDAGRIGGPRQPLQEDGLALRGQRD